MISLQIIKAIESMNQWTSHVMTSWVEYHLHRCFHFILFNTRKVVILVTRTQLKGGLTMEGLMDSTKDDLCQVLPPWPRHGLAF